MEINCFTKKWGVTLLCQLVCLFAFGQNFSPSNGSLTTLDNQTLAVFDVSTNNKAISNVRLGMKKKAVEKLADMIAKYGKKAKDWASTAQREGVKDYEKELYGVMSVPIADVERVSFIADGESYSKKYSNTMMSQITLTIGYPKFMVNVEGSCFMYVAANVGSLKAATGKTIETTTTVNSGGLLNPQTTVGHSTAREMSSYDVGWVHLYIPVSDIDAFVAHLKQLSHEFDNKKADKKAIDKLFK
jgi:hypothetical protein